MMDKERLLAHLTSRWQALTQALEGVPHEEFEHVWEPGQWSVKEICAFLTAWDGEVLRRIDFVTGKHFTPSHDPDDTAYWEAWGKKQVEIKSVMPPQGVLIDMVGTRQRLLSRVAELNDFQLERWITEDPQATQPYYARYLALIQAWRAAWDEANPPPKGLRKVWYSLQEKFRLYS